MGSMLKSEFLGLGVGLGGLYLGAIVIAWLVKIMVTRDRRIVDKGVVGGIIGGTWINVILNIVTVTIIAFDFYEALTGGMPSTRQGIMVKMFMGIFWIQLAYVAGLLIKGILPKETDASDRTKDNIYHMVTRLHIVIIAYLSMIIAALPLFKRWGIIVAIIGTIILVELSSKILGKLTGLFIKEEVTQERARMINNWITIGWDVCCLGIIIYQVIRLF